MTYYKYLHPRKYYEDLYDKFTVEDCRSTENFFLKQYPQYKKVDFQLLGDNDSIPADEYIERKQALEKMPKDQQKMIIAYNVTLRVLIHKTGDRYLQREETIENWIKRDEERDLKRERLWNINDPQEDKRCRECGDFMKCFHKDFHSIGDKPDQILFIYECIECKYREGEFDNGELYEMKGSRCPKCNAQTKDTTRKLKTKIKVKTVCTSCDFKDEYEWDLSGKEKPKTKADLEEEKLFERDKLRFCITPKQGERYRKFKSSMEQFVKVCQEIDARVEREKENPLLEAQKRIKNTLKGKKFLKMKFGEPEIGRDIIFEFKVYESDNERNEYNATKELKKMIEKALEGTNWKLMSEGVSARMGIFSGRIRGIEMRR